MTLHVLFFDFLIIRCNNPVTLEPNYEPEVAGTSGVCESMVRNFDPTDFKVRNQKDGWYWLRLSPLGAEKRPTRSCRYGKNVGRAAPGEALAP